MSFIRAREIEGVLRERGQERGTVYVLQTLAEQQIALQQSIRDLAELVNQMADLTSNFAAVAINMKGVLDNLPSDKLYEDGGPKNTQDM